MYLTPRNQFHGIAWGLILIFKAKKINLNQYIASLEYRIENESTAYSSEPEFLSDVNRTMHLVIMKKGGYGIERDERRGNKGILGI